MSDERIIPKIDLGLYEEAHAEICKRCRLRLAHLEVELVWARARRPEPNFRLELSKLEAQGLMQLTSKKLKELYSSEVQAYIVKRLRHESGFKVILKAYLGSTLRAS